MDGAGYADQGEAGAPGAIEPGAPNRSSTRPGLGGGNPLVFPSGRGKRLTDVALSGWP